MVDKKDGLKAREMVMRKGHRPDDCSADWMAEKLVDQSDQLLVTYLVVLLVVKRGQPLVGWMELMTAVQRE